MLEALDAFETQVLSTYGNCAQCAQKGEHSG